SVRSRRDRAFRPSPRLHVDLGPVGKARESVRDERVGGGDSLSGLRTEIRVLLVVLEHLVQFVCAREEIVVGIGRPSYNLEVMPEPVQRGDEVVPRVGATADVEVGERTYLDRFWNELSADPKSIDEETRRHFAALYARQGAMHSAFE